MSSRSASGSGQTPDLAAAREELERLREENKEMRHWIGARQSERADL